MAANKQLGVYFGQYSLSIVETENQSPGKYFNAPHNLFDSSDQAQSKNVPDDIKLTAIIQKSIRDQKISTSEVSLSLPTKNIIFRSFVIPWMTANEIEGVIAFEARKYIPFKMEELSFTYHALTITEKSLKKIRILFVAIRNDTLEKYCGILEQSGLRISFIEPAVVSLIRLLVFKKRLPMDQRIAIVQTSAKDGKIIIVDHGLPHFVRDFQLQAAPAAKPESDPDLIKARLFNEVRISLDYYGRQHSQEHVDSVITLSDSKSIDMAASLGSELGLPTTALDIRSIMEADKEVDIDLAFAFGVGLRETVTSLPKFNLAPINKKKESLQSKLANIKIDYITLAKTAAVCAVMLIATYFLTARISWDLKSKISKSEGKAGPFKDLTADQIELKNKEVLAVLDAYKSVRLKSDITFFLTHIPTLLLKGTWLNELGITYYDNSVADNPDVLKSTIFLSLSGKAYLAKTYQQIHLVNNLVANIKSNQEFAKFFKDINLTTAKIRESRNFTITDFQIECK